MIDYRLYTEEEMKLIQKQMVENNRLASEAVKKRGIKINPRIKAASLK